MNLFRRYQYTVSLRLLPALLLLGLLFLRPEAAAAHPLGNFSVNRYSRLALEAERIQIDYVVDMAEIPTYQERLKIDESGDGRLSAAERERYVQQQVATLREGLALVVNGTPLKLEPQAPQLTFTPGSGDLLTMRLEVIFVSALPAGINTAQASYEDRNYGDRLGWQEIVVQAMESATLLSSNVPADDISQALQSYPDDLLQEPLVVSSAAFRFQPGAVNSARAASGTQSAPAETASVATGSVAADRFGDDAVAALITGPLAVPQLSFGVLLAAIVAAFGLGAAHALTPGHGKTIVGAYLVGSRGTARHALFLGLTTTITHTLGIFVLGLVVLFASRFILPEQLYPWLSVLSGVLVALIGASLLRGRWRSWHAEPDHRAETGYHTHFGVQHKHQSTAHDTSWRNLLALGVSGGLLPCPSALVLLLSAMALQRLVLGLFLIVVFSLGLASVLTTVGLLLVYAGRLFQRLPAGKGRLLAALPLASALFITGAGVVITVQALALI